MGFTVDFHDSEVRDVVADGTGLRVRFAAAAARDAASERGWLSSVQLEFTDAVVCGDMAHAFGKVAEGSLRQAGCKFGVSKFGVRSVFLQCEVAPSGDAWSCKKTDLTPNFLTPSFCELALRLANGTQFTVRGRTLVASVGDDARFTPDLSC